MEKVRLEELWKRGKDFLGTKKAIIAGAMAWISDSNLVSAVSNAGGFGVIACGSMTPDLLKSEVLKTKEKTNKPFGVNLIVMHPELDALVDVAIETEMTHVFFAGGFPRKDIISKLKDKNIKTVGFAPSLIIAKKLIRSGIDALIIEGMEAGGHIGPVSTSVLAQEILPHITDTPVFVAGGIGQGSMISSYLQMGAAGVQIGTLFACSSESIAHENFKNIFIKSSARHAVASAQVSPDFPIIPVRAIQNKASEEFIRFQREQVEKFERGETAKEDTGMAIEHFWAGSLKKAVIDGDVENGSVMAGQSVGMVKKIKPVASIIKELVFQAEEFLG